MKKQIVNTEKLKCKICEGNFAQIYRRYFGERAVEGDKDVIVLCKYHHKFVYKPVKTRKDKMDLINSRIWYETKEFAYLD